MKKIASYLMVALMLAGFLTGCTAPSTMASTAASAVPTNKVEAPVKSPEASATKKLVIGFAQIGSESNWRTAMSDDVKQAIKNAGWELQFSDGQGQQENQIKALRSFIMQGVDYIVLAPIVTTGWDAVLKEIKDAGIPLIIVNRSLKFADDKQEDYYLTFAGPDNVYAAELATKQLISYIEKNSLKTPINVVEISGPVGSGPAVERDAGFMRVVKSNTDKLNLYSTVSVTDFTRVKGKECMEALIKKANAENVKIDAVFSQTDDMALGAEQAMLEAGMKPGSDVIIFSIDGNKSIFEAMIAGQHNWTVENPNNYGKVIVDIITRHAKGETINKKTILYNELYTADMAAAALPNRKW